MASLLSPFYLGWDTLHYKEANKYNHPNTEECIFILEKLMQVFFHLRIVKLKLVERPEGEVEKEKGKERRKAKGGKQQRKK